MNNIENSTLKDSKAFLREGWEKGVDCPCCGQFVKQYKRKFNSSMAYALIIIYKLHIKHGFEKWVKMNQEIANLGIPSSNVEYAKLRHWNLLEERGNSDESKRTSGNWRITKTGIRFFLNQITIPSHVFIYNNKIQGYSKTQTTVKKSLGKKFNYEELMNS